MPYTSAFQGRGGARAPRDREAHGARLRGELTASYLAFDAARARDSRLEGAESTVLELELTPGSKVEAVERKRDKFQPGAARIGEESRNVVVGLHLPDRSRDRFDAILREYQEGALTQKGKPQRRGFVEAIESIQHASLETFWTDKPELLPQPGKQTWWEVWCRRDQESHLESMVNRLEVRTIDRERRLYFPEHVVLSVLADRSHIEFLIFASPAIQELRRAGDSPTFYLDDIDRDERYAFLEDLAERTQWPGADAPAVCLLDTGVNRAHTLIEPALAEGDMSAVRPEWGVDDSTPPKDHGTMMAGLALFGDLTARLGDQEAVPLGHRLESVKVLPPEGMAPTPEHAYGAVTKQAVALPESKRPTRRRVFCLAVTNDGRSGIRPSTWSASIDQEAAGVTEAGQPAPRRLFVVCTGNAPNPMAPDQIADADALEIEDPAQAWNAITVGGYTDKINIQEPGLAEYSPYAQAGDISPYSRTSARWSQGKTPFKPDIVMEAGNRVISPAENEVLDADSLALLSTGPQTDRHPLVAFRATSAAAAQAARLAGRLMAEFPEYWPETIRALIIHGTQWTPVMRGKFDEAQSKAQTCAALRRYGHGVPTFERAAASARNHLAIVSQAEIQPYKRSGRGMNECHFYRLPWPRSALESLGDEQLSLKVTLSYFVEPNPGSSASFDPYRYQSHGLRFDLKRQNETDPLFKKRVNRQERDEDYADSSRAQPDSDNWLFGSKSMSAGSLHSDEWTGSAVDLLTRDLICIKPVGGWWSNRADASIRSQKTRYALILSLHAPDSDIDLHTPIAAEIAAEAEVQAVNIPTGA